MFSYFLGKCTLFCFSSLDINPCLISFLSSRQGKRNRNRNPTVAGAIRNDSFADDSGDESTDAEVSPDYCVEGAKFYDHFFSNMLAPTERPDNRQYAAGNLKSV